MQKLARGGVAKFNLVPESHGSVKNDNAKVLPNRCPTAISSSRDFERTLDSFNTAQTVLLIGDRKTMPALRYVFPHTFAMRNRRIERLTEVSAANERPGPILMHG